MHVSRHNRSWVLPEAPKIKVGQCVSRGLVLCSYIHSFFSSSVIVLMPGRHEAQFHRCETTRHMHSWPHQISAKSGPVKYLNTPIHKTNDPRGHSKSCGSRTLRGFGPTGEDNSQS